MMCPISGSNTSLFPYSGGIDFSASVFNRFAQNHSCPSDGYLNAYCETNSKFIKDEQLLKLYDRDICHIVGFEKLRHMRWVPNINESLNFGASRGVEKGQAFVTFRLKHIDWHSKEKVDSRPDYLTLTVPNKNSSQKFLTHHHLLLGYLKELFHTGKIATATPFQSYVLDKD